MGGGLEVGERPDLSQAGRIDAVLLSHAHVDHVGALDRLAEDRRSAGLCHARNPTPAPRSPASPAPRRAAGPRLCRGAGPPPRHRPLGPCARRNLDALSDPARRISLHRRFQHRSPAPALRSLPAQRHSARRCLLR
ncbi:MBL fold metallo-hydrolase [Alloyangia mangrovi]